MKDVISWQNVISVALDNTNANMGISNSFKSRIPQKNPDCLNAGCNCHLAHLADSKSGAAYHKKTVSI